MPKEFKLPDLGEGIHEGEIVEVLVSVGDRVEDGQSIMVIETDKATTEVPSPVTGVVKEIKVKAGDTVSVGDVLMTFTEEGEAEAPEEPRAAPERIPREEERPEPELKEAKAPPREKKKEEEEARERKEAEREREREAERARKPEAPPEEKRGPVPAAPSTRRLARELGIDLQEVEPSGPGGRVTSEDVRAHAKKAEKAKERPEAPPERPEAPEEKPPEEAPAAPAIAPVPPLPDFGQWGRVERESLRSVRRATAKRMTWAWTQIPHVTHEDIADITELEAFRRKHKEEIEAKGGALSLTVFALKAAAAALKAFPRFNASLDMEAGEIILKKYYHIGVAVDTDRGLLVPVIRDVDCKSITELAGELNELVRRARDGKADLSDMSGGTFTITNVGSLGGTTFTPIINYPQVAIMGMPQARLQPVVRGDENDYEIVPRLLLPVIVGFDHRILDGADAARFVRMIIGALENPEKLLMLM